MINRILLSSFVAIIMIASSALAQTDEYQSPKEARDSEYQALLPHITFNNKVVRSHLDFITLYNKASTKMALFSIVSEKFFGEKAVLIPLSHAKENDHWKIKAGLAFFENGTIYDSSTFICMNSHEIWHCPPPPPPNCCIDVDSLMKTLKKVKR